MGYKTVTVDINLDEFDDSELIVELEGRGYTCIKEEEAAGLEREDWLHLIEMLDKQPVTWYTRRVRDKLMVACHG